MHFISSSGQRPISGDASTIIQRASGWCIPRLHTQTPSSRPPILWPTFPRHRAVSWRHGPTFSSACFFSPSSSLPSRFPVIFRYLDAENLFSSMRGCFPGYLIKTLTGCDLAIIYPPLPTRCGGRTCGSSEYVMRKVESILKIPIRPAFIRFRFSCRAMLPNEQPFIIHYAAVLNPLCTKLISLFLCCSRKR